MQTHVAGEDLSPAFADAGACTGAACFWGGGTTEIRPPTESRTPTHGPSWVCQGDKPLSPKPEEL